MLGADRSHPGRPVRTPALTSPRLARARAERPTRSRALCAHPFALSIKGRPYTWLQNALERGDLAGARGEASEIPNLNLGDALAIVLLMAAAGDQAFDRAAAKWIARLGLEHRVGLEDLRVAVDALSALPRYPDHAKRSLCELCARHGLPRVVGIPAIAGRSGVPGPASPQRFSLKPRNDGEVSGPGTGKTSKLTVKLPTTAVSAIRRSLRARGSKSVVLKLQLVVSDLAGNRTTLTRSITVKR